MTQMTPHWKVHATYQLTFNLRNNYWIVTIRNAGSYHTPTLKDALAFIEHYHTAATYSGGATLNSVQAHIDRDTKP